MKLVKLTVTSAKKELDPVFRALEKLGFVYSSKNKYECIMVHRGKGKSINNLFSSLNKYLGLKRNSKDKENIAFHEPIYKGNVVLSSAKLNSNLYSIRILAGAIQVTKTIFK